jgi:hypothetical protein
MLVLSELIPLGALAAAASLPLLLLPFLRETSSFSPAIVTAETSGAGKPLALNALSRASSKLGPLYEPLLLLLPALAVSLLAAARSLSAASWLGSVIVAVVPACRQ